MHAQMGFHDRQETDAEMRAGTTLFLRARERYASLTEPGEPIPGSMLAQENVATAFDPVGHQVMRHRVRAADSIEMLMDAMHDVTSGAMRARPMAMYALVRMSIEASAVAQWTIRSSRKSERIFRSLRIARGALDEYADFAKAVARPEEAAPYRQFRDEKVERLTQLKNAVGPLRQKALSGPPRLSQILIDVSPVRPHGEPHRVDSPYVIWKMASAFLHGSDHLTRQLGDLRQITEGDGVGASFMVTPSWQLLCSCVAACVMELERLDQRTWQLATTDYAGRRLV